MSRSPANELHDLLGALRDGGLTREQAATLDRLIATDAAARTEYVLYTLIRADLRDRYSGRKMPTLPPADVEREAVVGPTSPIGRLRIARYAGLAAALLIVGVVAVVGVAPGASGPTDTSIGATGAAAVASIIDSDTSVYVDNAVAQPGEVYQPGVYAIDHGSAELLLTSRASVRMQGPTRLVVEGGMSSSLVRGTAFFDCPPDAVGYAVHLPDGSRIVDLGTRFAARVDEAGVAMVQVLEGRVALFTAEGERELAAGETVQVIDGAAKPLGDRRRWIAPPDAPPVDPAAYQAAVRSLGPIAYWSFEGDGEDRYTDGSSWRVAQAHGEVRTAGEQDNRHMVLDGRAHVAVAGDAALDAPGNRLTVAAWVKLDSREHQAIVHKWARGAGYSIEIFNERPGFAVALAGDRPRTLHVVAEAPAPTGRWVLLAGVYDGQTVSIYVDGEIAGVIAAPTIDAPLSVSATPLMIGRRSDASAGFVLGSVDEVAIFAHALNPEQVRTLANPSEHRPTE